MTVNENECKRAGLDPRKVQALARRLESVAKDAAKLELTIFGGSSGGNLRFYDQSNVPPLIVAEIHSGRFDGGCGACMPDEEGLLRGE